MELILKDGKRAVPITAIGLHLQCSIGHPLGQTETRLVLAEQCDSPEEFWMAWNHVKTFTLRDQNGNEINPVC